MTNEVKTEKSLVKTVDEKTIRDFLFTSETKLNQKQQNMFLQIAIRHNLDPFKREVYAIAYGNEFSIVTGYEVYIKRAEKTGKLDGWCCENTEEGAKITIHRNDWTNPFEWEVTYTEFNKGQSSWKKMPKFMIKKVCIGQGFRLAFSEDLGGMPYLREEMEGAEPFVEKKAEVRKTGSKSTSEASKTKSMEVITTIGRITPKSGKNPHKLLGENDFIYSTYSDSIATMAQTAMESGMKVKMKIKRDQYNTIETIDLEEDKDPGEEG